MEAIIEVKVDIEATLNSIAEVAGVENNFAELLAQWILEDPQYFLDEVKDTTKKRLIEMLQKKK